MADTTPASVPDEIVRLLTWLHDTYTDHAIGIWIHAFLAGDDAKRRKMLLAAGMDGNG